jgi:RNA polymerase sigma factor (sigma-70 family)
MGEPPGHTTQLQCWLDLMRAGNSQARERLIEHACERLRLITRKMLRDSPKIHRWEETDDVFIAAVTKLHRSLEAVQPESVRDFYNLAATQIRRVLVDLARRYYGPEGLGANYDTGAVAPDGKDAARHDRADFTGEPASVMEWTEFHQQVESLPEEEKAVFSLLWYSGLTQQEATHALGISERTLRRRWRSARVSLYEALGGEPPSE